MQVDQKFNMKDYAEREDFDVHIKVMFEEEPHEVVIISAKLILI